MESRGRRRGRCQWCTTSPGVPRRRDSISEVSRCDLARNSSFSTSASLPTMVCFFPWGGGGRRVSDVINHLNMVRGKEKTNIQGSCGETRSSRNFPRPCGKGNQWRAGGYMRGRYMRVWKPQMPSF
jgi:hypothetical protein